MKFIANAVVILIGWVVVHHLSAKRDRQKARCDLVVSTGNDLSKQVDEILFSALKYHQADRDLAEERKLLIGLKDVAQKLAGLVNVCTNHEGLRACQMAAMRLRVSISGKHFEDEHLAPLGASDYQLEDIADAALATKRALADLKYAQYQEKSIVSSAS